MHIAELIKPTGVGRPGMQVRDVFQLCVEADVPGIPYVDQNGDMHGKLSIRHMLKESCIPDFMVNYAHFLGDALDHLTISEETMRQVLAYPVEDFILPQTPQATPNTPFSKALAIMEEQDTTYLFVVDDGIYKGTISIMGIAHAMLENT